MRDSSGKAPDRRQPCTNPMEEKHRTVLRTTRLYLLDNLEPRVFSDRMLQDGLITEDDLERIDNETTRRDQINYLLRKLPLKGPDAFDRFLKVLRATRSQSFIATHLQEKVEALDRGEDIGANNIVDSDEEEYDVSKLVDQYPMKERPRGLSLIINNRWFTGNLRKRLGTDIDADNLEGLFRFLGFRVQRVDDQRSDTMRQVMKKLANENYSKYDCVIVAILSHGEDGYVYGLDEKPIPVEEITGYFKSSTSLAGKPKLFFLQSCRGARMDPGVVVPDDFDDPDIKTEEIDQFIRDALSGDEIDGTLSKLPIEADFLISYSTSPGYVSWRNQVTGSWFIDSLVEVFYTMAHKEHLLDMLTMVNNRVATQYESATGAKKQMPAPVSTLTKKLYFRPGK